MTLFPTAHEGGDRADGDDVPPLAVDGFLGGHDVGDGLDDEEGPVQVHVLYFTPEVVGEGEEGVEGAYPRVGDQVIDPPEYLGCFYDLA